MPTLPPVAQTMPAEPRSSGDIGRSLEVVLVYLETAGATASARRNCWGLLEVWLGERRDTHC